VGDISGVLISRLRIPDSVGGVPRRYTTGDIGEYSGVIGVALVSGMYIGDVCTGVMPNGSSSWLGDNLGTNSGEARENWRL
jgi:hypothetical protein